MTIESAWLLAALMVAHYMGDFTVLATARMLASKAAGGPLYLIGAHAGVHGLVVAPILVVASASVGPAVLATTGVVLSHFLIDTVRARVGLRFSALSDPTRKAFWSALGFDQLLHGLVLIWATMQVL